MKTTEKNAVFALVVSAIFTGFLYWLLNIEWGWDFGWGWFAFIFVAASAQGFVTLNEQSAAENLANMNDAPRAPAERREPKL